MTTAMLPARYRVIARSEENHDTVTLGLEPVDQPIAPCLPGQFTMLYAFGVGEVPVSVSGIGRGAGEFKLAQTVRKVGAVTRALCAAAPGTMIGVRGPYGTDWGLSGAAAQRRDVVVVAGGIGLAPLRPVLLEALAERERYGRVVLLAGARSPEDLIFTRELDVWRRRGIDVEATIDRPVSGWDGHVGFVSQLIPRAHFDPGHAMAFVCGPEVMMRLSARALIQRGMAPRDIRVSLERNMRCGVAQCGHCQLGPVLVCRDGPVVSYEFAAPLFAIKEL
jgi:anaerobic sulfite reductase subunit B